jgi:ribosomal protein S18 acetylase RimI-like enzyme
MQIRPATLDDHETIAALWEESRLPTVALEEWDSLIGSPNAMILLAEDEGALSGAVVASFDGWRAYIYHIAVVPGRRQTGVASTLMREAEERLQALGARGIFTMVHETNAAGLRLTGALGYEVQAGELVLAKGSAVQP